MILYTRRETELLLYIYIHASSCTVILYIIIFNFSFPFARFDIFTMQILSLSHAPPLPSAGWDIDVPRLYYMNCTRNRHAPSTARTASRRPGSLLHAYWWGDAIHIFLYIIYARASHTENYSWHPVRTPTASTHHHHHHQSSSSSSSSVVFVVDSHARTAAHSPSLQKHTHTSSRRATIPPQECWMKGCFISSCPTDHPGTLMNTSVRIYVW